MSLLRGLNGEPLAQVITLRRYRITNPPFIIRSLFSVSSMHLQRAKDLARGIASEVNQSSECLCEGAFISLPSK